jgi:hypothetical protein
MFSICIFIQKKQRLELFFKMEASKKTELSYVDESMTATSILSKQMEDDYQGNLNRTATEILNGVQRNVEVQIISSEDFYAADSGKLKRNFSSKIHSILFFL